MKIKDIIEIINKDDEYLGKIAIYEGEELRNIFNEYKNWLNEELPIKNMIHCHHNTFTNGKEAYISPYQHKPSFDINQPYC